MIVAGKAGTRHFEVLPLRLEVLAQLFDAFALNFSYIRNLSVLIIITIPLTVILGIV